MKKTLARLAVVAVLAGGFTAAQLPAAPEAAAHPYVNGCRGTHISGPYHNFIERRTIQSAAGTYGPWVTTDWRVVNDVTKSTHYHRTERRCIRVF